MAMKAAYLIIYVHIIISFMLIQQGYVREGKGNVVLATRLLMLDHQDLSADDVPSLDAPPSASSLDDHNHHYLMSSKVHKGFKNKKLWPAPPTPATNATQHY
ncbi:OLC1v1026505C1 [Oldenlandia corymbosa var. corymbosa]|uniref:OLC1v1026505C1 n=1 Tax=Oldenlandia corymbosa var. corymbosa TaxID=529605 RepID=A0AAV1C769_OLDCO|nr:OLC1v1026505C1 [Oldenlandia corymbosa var. corymbosa]